VIFDEKELNFELLFGKKISKIQISKDKHQMENF
jgi:hypothetical protein